MKNYGTWVGGANNMHPISWGGGYKRKRSYFIHKTVRISPTRSPRGSNGKVKWKVINALQNYIATGTEINYGEFIDETSNSFLNKIAY